jgi:Ran GTPase-activating protein (RanGAP) involved in mRNA processing and transport
MEDKVNTYKEECSSHSIEPLASIVRYFESVGDLTELAIHGNDKYNFHARVTDQHLVPLLAVLSPNAENILTIDLRYNLLTDTGITNLSDFLKLTKSLKKLNLMGNDIGPKGAKDLATVLKDIKTLEYLNVNGNHIETDGCIAITELIFYNTQLTYFNLGNNDIKYDGIIALANVIGYNSTVQVLNMENPSLPSSPGGQEWTPHIGKMLANNIGLLKLSLRKYKLRCDGTYTIMKQFMENKKLQVLDLGANEISVEGCMAIANFLKQEDCVLEGLQLPNNKAGDLGAKAIAQALSTNKSLRYLDFAYNNINDDGLSRIAESLNINTTLQILKLFGHNYFGQESMSLFFKLQAKKPKYYLDFTVYIVDEHYDMGYIDNGPNKTWTL